MQKEAIQAIVNSAKSAGLEDYLIIYDDNARIYRYKSQTSTGYFDDGKEVYYSFNLNDNPLRNTQSDALWLVEACTYDHITSITVKIPNDKVQDVISKYNFEENEIKRIMKNVGRPSQASGYTYTQGNEDPVKKAGFKPTLELGVPYEPYNPNKEAETTGN